MSSVHEPVTADMSSHPWPTTVPLGLCPDSELVMQGADVLSRPSRPPDFVLSYGEGNERVADLRRPSGQPGSRAETIGGPRPLVLFLHGGFWRAAYDRAHAGPLAEALAANGFVVCTPEYRRVGQPGGGWPGTFDDVADAVRILPGAVTQATGGLIDPGRVVVAGHSAGGHLALWVAAQTGAERTVTSQLAVVSLAGVCDLAATYRQNLDNGAAAALIGGGPELFPGRYAAADPMNLVPIGAGLTLLHGSSDNRVPWQQSRDFAAKALAAGDQADFRLLEGRDHFALIDPLSAAWPAVLAAFRSAAAGLGQL